MNYELWRLRESRPDVLVDEFRDAEEGYKARDVAQAKSLAEGKTLAQERYGLRPGREEA